MPEFARTIVALLRKVVADRRRSKRQRVRLAVSVSIVSPAKGLNGSRRAMRMDGHTLDLAAHGMALIVPAIILGQYHLVGENRRLKVQLELPPGPVEMQVVALRYERLEDHKTETGYLIAVKIVEMSAADETKYAEYVSTLLARKQP